MAAAGNSPKSKVLLVGWDAADWKVIHPLVDQGKMPAVASLIEAGTISNLATLQPPLSPMLWTSIATGKRPFNHGIHGFTEPTPDGRSVRPVTNVSRTTKAVWNIFSQSGLKSNVVGWWPSHPAEPINGVMVSNHFQQAVGPPDKPWPVPRGAVHPPRLTQTLAPLRLNPNELLAQHILPFIPLAGEIDQDQDVRLASCGKILAECTSVHAVATHLMQHEPWDFMAVYYDAIDHFCHGFMRYHPPRRQNVSERDFELYGGVVEAGYRYHDMMLATLLAMAGPDVTVILMSDHGFHPDHLRPSSVPMEPAGPAFEHRDLGIFAIKGPGIKQDALVHGLSILDVAPTLLHLFDLPVGEDMDGSVAVEAFEQSPDVKTIPSWDEVAGDDGTHPSDLHLSESESAEAVKQLVALGYVEELGADTQVAVRKTTRELQYNLARAYRDDHRHAAACNILEQLYEEWPEEHRFGIQLALTYRALDQIADLRTTVETLTERVQADAEAAKQELSVLRAEYSSDPDSDTEQQPPNLSPAAEMRARKLQSRAQASPWTLDYLWGSLHMAEGDYEEAVRRFRLADRRSLPGNAFLLPTAEALLKLRRPRQAARNFRMAARIDSHNPEAWCGLARCALRARRYRVACRLALKAIGLQHHYPLAHYALGVGLARSGRTDQAIVAFERAISQNPNFAEAHRWLAWMHEIRKLDPAKAAEHRRLANEMRDARRESRRRKAVFQPADWQPSSPPAHPGADADKRRAEQVVNIDKPLIIVSGLPRSGTSMVMQMLAAGGISPFTDSAREPDENNPKGYYEHESVKRMGQDWSWLGEASGKAVKIIAQLLPRLPEKVPCRIVMVQRDMNEILRSQADMLERSAKEGAALAPDRLSEVFRSQLAAVERWLIRRPHTAVLALKHEHILANPRAAAEQLAKFVNQSLDVTAMAAAVDLSLYRSRGKR